MYNSIRIIITGIHKTNSLSYCQRTELGFYGIQYSHHILSSMVPRVMDKKPLDLQKTVELDFDEE